MKIHASHTIPSNRPEDDHSVAAGLPALRTLQIEGMVGVEISFSARSGLHFRNEPIFFAENGKWYMRFTVEVNDSRGTEFSEVMVVAETPDEILLLQHLKTADSLVPRLPADIGTWALRTHSNSCYISFIAPATCRRSPPTEQSPR